MCNSSVFSKTATGVNLIVCRAKVKRKQLILTVFPKTINSLLHCCLISCIFSILLCSSVHPLKTRPGVGTRSAPLHKRRKTLQSLPIHCRTSNFQRGTSLLAFMHNHTSECTHRLVLIGNVNFFVTQLCNGAFYFSVTGFCRLSSAWHLKETHTVCLFFFFTCTLSCRS